MLYKITMIEIDIPGFGKLKFEYLVSDFSGTLSVDGVLLPNIKTRLRKAARLLNVRIITTDTYGTVTNQLKDIGVEIHVVRGPNADIQKEEYVEKLGAGKVVALGNGMNDRRMLRAARLGIAVMEGEGCVTDAIAKADICVRSASEGLDLLLKPERCKATLRF